jgi:hypothetical protein
MPVTPGPGEKFLAVSLGFTATILVCLFLSLPRRKFYDCAKVVSSWILGIISADLNPQGVVVEID